MDSGLLDWETKISDLLPEWGLNVPFAEKNSELLDILSHRTGLPCHISHIAPETRPKVSQHGMNLPKKPRVVDQ